MVQSQSLHGGDHRTATAPSNKQCLLSYLSREGTGKRVTQQLDYAMPVASQQRGAKTVQERQHGNSAVFGVIYTL